MTLSAYIEQLSKRFASGMAKEHAYRADLEALLRTLAPGLVVTNEPANVTDCGNPDFVITKGKIPVGYIEAKKEYWQRPQQQKLQGAIRPLPQSARHTLRRI